jgi:hypothetical protein
MDDVHSKQVWHFLTRQLIDLKIVCRLSRFAKWKRDAEYWYERDSVMFENLYKGVNEKLVCLSG